MKGKLKIILIVACATVITASIAVVGTNQLKSKSTANTKTTVSTAKTDKAQEKSDDIDKTAVLDMLEKQGLDRKTLEKQYEGANGSTILGDALPVEDFKTLADAEKSFGYFLGLHNTLDSVSGYSLVSVHIVNKEFMQAVYENKESTKSITVKTSIAKTAKELIKVYKERKSSDTIKIQNIDVTVSGDTKEVLNVASFSAPNKKSYSINTEAGLTADEMNKLLSELIGNLQNMTDWVD